MKKSDRYDTSALHKAQFEPGSNGRVLKINSAYGKDLCENYRAVKN